ncbi:MAG: sulfatase-like hydrolase/transferase [Planctomycetes bacterium]|nr:sulfatase-like hydrolase/transferase [Planctomycetota bacterium]MCW8135402.1 sulfatase-like hydrolase/transferase [Planctomycetota bacterium]
MADRAATAAARPAVPVSALAAGGYVFMAVLILTLPWLEFMTEPLHQRATHFQLSMYLDYLLMLLAVTALAWPVYLLARAVFAQRMPRLWQALLGLVVGAIAGTAITYRAAMGIGQMLHVDAFVWVFQNTWVFAAVTAGLVALLPPVRLKVLLFSRVIARLLAPLPLVMLAYFAVQPSHETRLDPLPAPAQTKQPPAPVILLVCDALDRELVFGESLHELPFLQRCRNEFTWFEQSRTPAFHTTEAMPSILFQCNDITRKDYEAVTDGGEDLWQGRPTIFDMLARPGDVRVVSGFHVLYGRVLAGRDITVRTRALSFPKHFSRPVRMYACLQQAAYLEYIPVVSDLLDPNAAWSDYYDAVGQEIMDDVHACVRDHGPNLVGVFHLAWPHPPFIYDRDGRIEGESSYQANSRYLDTRLQQLAALLRERGLWDSCTLIITGDHGYPFTGERHPPLLIKLPGQTTGRTVSEVTRTSEIADWLSSQPEFTALRPPK